MLANFGEKFCTGKIINYLLKFEINNFNFNFITHCYVTITHFYLHFVIESRPILVNKAKFIINLNFFVHGVTLFVFKMSLALFCNCFWFNYYLIVILFMKMPKFHYVKNIKLVTLYQCSLTARPCFISSAQSKREQNVIVRSILK